MTKGMIQGLDWKNWGKWTQRVEDGKLRGGVWDSDCGDGALGIFLPQLKKVFTKGNLYDKVMLLLATLKKALSDYVTGLVGLWPGEWELMGTSQSIPI